MPRLMLATLIAGPLFLTAAVAGAAECSTQSSSTQGGNGSTLATGAPTAVGVQAPKGQPGSLAARTGQKPSGEKGGTADINIGVGELQECTISKSG